MKGFHRRIIPAFLSALALLSALGGCGETSVHEELTDRSNSPSVIRIAWWGSEERDRLTKEVLDLYSELHPEIIFETLPSEWNDYFQILSLKTAQGDMPDLVQMDYQYITTYTQNGSLADLSGFVEDGTIRTEDWDEGALKSGVIDGRLSGIVLGTAVLSMTYNPDVFLEAGIPFPDSNWTWEDFKGDCLNIRERTGKYGAAMTPILDLNLFHYWVRQHGEELFSPDQRSLGYEDDSIYIEYVTLFKELIDKEAVPNSDDWAAISVQGQENAPIITGDGGLTVEWNNYPLRMSYVNDRLKLAFLPLASQNGMSGVWMKPGMYFSVAETSSLKTECARFIDWFVNSEEANRIMKGERGVPVSKHVREDLLDGERLSEVQREMFLFTDKAAELCGDTPPPEPSGIEEINSAFSETANSYFYGAASAEEAAAQFRHRVNRYLAANNQ